MQIGQFDRYIRFEQKSVVQDNDYGSEIVTWVKYKECWANVQDITTRMQESTVNNLRLMKHPCKITVRYDAGIDSTMRIVALDDNNKILQIVTKPAEIGRREAMEFTAEDYDANA